MTHEAEAFKAFDIERRKQRMSLAYTAYGIFFTTIFYRHSIEKMYVKCQFVRTIFKLTFDRFRKHILRVDVCSTNIYSDD